MEVAIARVYNWEVVQKRKDQTEEGTEAERKKDNSKEWPHIKGARV